MKRAAEEDAPEPRKKTDPEPLNIWRSETVDIKDIKLQDLLPDVEELGCFHGPRNPALTSMVLTVDGVDASVLVANNMPQVYRNLYGSNVVTDETAWMQSAFLASIAARTSLARREAPDISAIEDVINDDIELMQILFKGLADGVVDLREWTKLSPQALCELIRVTTEHVVSFTSCPVAHMCTFKG